MTETELLIQRKQAKIIQPILQLAVIFPFGYVIDFWLFCMKSIEPQNYIMQLALVFIGCFVVAFGVYLQVTADVVMLPGDAFVRAVAGATGKEFGKMRMVSDITMTSAAFILCLIFVGGLQGIREGTVISAFLVGNLVRFYNRKLHRFTKMNASSR